MVDYLKTQQLSTTGSKARLDELCEGYSLLLAGQPILPTMPEKPVGYTKEALMAICNHLNIQFTPSRTSRPKLWKLIRAHVMNETPKEAPKKAPRKTALKKNQVRDETLVAEFTSIQNAILSFVAKRDQLRVDLDACDPKARASMDKNTNKNMGKKRINPSHSSAASPSPSSPSPFGDIKKKTLTPAQIKQRLASFVERFHRDDISDQEYSDIANDIAEFFMDEFDGKNVNGALKALMKKMFDQPEDKEYRAMYMEEVKDLIVRIALDRSNQFNVETGLAGKEQKTRKNELTILKERLNREAREKGLPEPYPDDEEEEEGGIDISNNISDDHEEEEEEVEL